MGHSESCLKNHLTISITSEMIRNISCGLLGLKQPKKLPKQRIVAELALRFPGSHGSPY